MEQTKPDSKNIAKLYPALEVQGDIEVADEYTIPIGEDHMFKITEDSDSYFVQLAQSIEGNYAVRFGTGQKTMSPVLNSKIEIPSNSHQTCFGATLVSPTVAIADCVKYNPSTAHHYYNYYYILTASGDHKIEATMVNSNYLNFLPLERKTLRYETSHNGITQMFLIQATPYDLQEGGVPEQTYLNIFRYVTIDSNEDNYHNGHLVAAAPINHNALELPKNLMLVDFAVLGDWIYVLDKNQGIVFFQYKGNQVINIKKKLYEKNIPRWGLSVSYIGSYIQMLVAENYAVIEYHMTLPDSDPVQVHSYRVESQIVSSVEIQSNQDYIVLQQGRLLTIYTRGEENIDYVKAQIQNAELFYLWYSNNIYVFHQERIVDYIIQRPFLEIKTTKEGADNTLTIKATSTNFDQKQTCLINLISVTIDSPTSKAAFYTGIPPTIEWTSLESFRTIIPLGDHWVGPNIQYLLPVDETKSTRFLAEKTVQNTQHTTVIDEPWFCNIQFKYEADEEWRFTKIIPLPGSYTNSFYSVHQDAQNKIVIFLCSPDLIDTEKITCGDPIGTINLTSRVRTMSFGTWGHNEDILALVQDDKPSYVEFYYVQPSTDHKVGELWFREDFNNVQTGFSNKILDIELQDNTLYTVIEGKTYRFIAISSYDTYVQHRDYITPEDVDKWPQVRSGTKWSPEEVITNPAYQNVIFIKSKNIIFVVNILEHTPLYLSYIALETEINTVVYVTNKALVVAQADNKVLDYSLHNLNWIVMENEFQYQTYEYEFISPFTITHGPNTGYIYILAKSIGKNDLCLLVYRSGVENIRTLVKVITIEASVTLDTQKQISLEAGGDAVDFIFLQYNGKKKFFRAPKDLQIVIYAKVDKTYQYVNIVEVDIEMHAWNGVEHDITHSITIVNGQTSIVVDYNEIGKNLPEILYANKKDHAEFQANVREWYNGSVVSMAISCSPNPEYCGDKIKLRNVVEPRSEDLSARKKIADMIQVNGLIYQLYIDPANDKDYIIGTQNYDLSFGEIYNNVTSHDNDYECFFLVPIVDSDGKLTYIATICYDHGLDRYLIQKIYNKKQNISAADGENFAYLQEIKEDSIMKGQYQYFQGHLFINSQGIEPTAGIYIYDLTNTVTETKSGKTFKEYDLVKLINEYDFNGRAPSLAITSFFVEYEHAQQAQDETYVKLILADSPDDETKTPSLWFLDLNVKDKFSIYEQNLDRLDYQGFVISHNLFVNINTKLLKLKFIEKEEKLAETLDQIVYRVIIMTDNTASYEMELSFTTYTSLPPKFSLSKSKIINVYNNYGINQPIKQIERYNNQIAIAYSNPLTKEVTIVCYELVEREKIIPNTNSDDSGVPLHSFQGGYKFQNEFIYIGNLEIPLSYTLFQDTQSKKTVVLTTDFSENLGLKALNFNPETIVLETNGKFETQSVEFTLKSDFSAHYNAFGAKVDPDKFVPVKPDGGSSNTGWIVAVSVIGGLLLLGGVAFWIWKKKKQPDNGYTRPSMTEATSDAGYSLQAPVKA